jgi:hypothetical protein
MKSNNVLVRTPSRKTRNSLTRGFAMLLLSVLCATALASSDKVAEDVVTPCEISMPREAREADFVVLYKFETKNGKPVNIRKVKNDFLKDADFVACVSRWTLPSLAGQGQAEFSYKHAEGWTEITVSGKGFKKSFHFTNDPKQSGGTVERVPDNLERESGRVATTRPGFTATGPNGTT